MAKRKRTRRPKTPREIPKKVIPTPTTSLVTEPSLDATLDPEGSETISRPWQAEDQTSIPEIGAPTLEEEEPLAESPSALTEKLLRGGLKINWTTLEVILIFGWAASLVWLFTQDNGSGKLDDAQGLWWFWIKASHLSVIPIILLILILIWGIYSSIRSRFQRG